MLHERIRNIKTGNADNRELQLLQIWKEYTRDHIHDEKGKLAMHKNIDGPEMSEFQKSEVKSAPVKY